MPVERRIKRLEQLVLEVTAETIQREVKDPRMGLVSITRVKLSHDLSTGTIFWSCLEEAGARRRVEQAMESVLPLLQRRVAKALRTRVTPTLSATFDRSLEHAQRLDTIFHQLAEERREILEEADAVADADPDEDADANADTDTDADTGQDTAGDAREKSAGEADG